MSWEEQLIRVFEDLEQQAEGLALADRDSEALELGRAAYAEVDLRARLHASLGRRVTLAVSGVGPVEGALTRAGVDFVVVDDDVRSQVVRTAAVLGARGLSERALAASARLLGARVGLGSVLRGLAAATVPVEVRRVDGSILRGRVRRVGADFCDLWVVQDYAEVSSSPELVPFAAVAALRSVSPASP